MSTRTIDSGELRRVLGAFVTGVTVITSVDSTGKFHGVTANSFSSVSLDPPLVLWSQSVAAGSYPVFRDAERFAVNILAEDQIAISDRFAKAGHDKFAGVDVRPGLGGIPLIAQCAGYLECTKVATYPGGDHTVFIGRVERIELSRRKPLVFGGGQYLIAQPHDLGAFSIDDGIASLAHVQAVRMATPALARLAEELNETLAMAVWGNHGPTVIRWEESKQPVSSSLRCGIVLPVTATATGLVFAAYLPNELTQSFVDAELEQAMHKQNVARDELERRLRLDLENVRANGCASILKRPAFPEMYSGAINAVSVPVFDRQDTVTLVLTAVGNAGSDDATWQRRVSDRLKERAAALSRRLGYRG